MPEDSFTQPRRTPFITKKISDIKQSDSRVRVFGTVIDSKENFAVIDDGSGKINVSFEEPVKVEGKVRVFGRIMPVENGFEIQGEFVQDMNDIDPNLYQRVEELEKMA